MHCNLKFQSRSMLWNLKMISDYPECSIHNQWFDCVYICICKNNNNNNVNYYYYVNFHYIWNGDNINNNIIIDIITNTCTSNVPDYNKICHKTWLMSQKNNLDTGQKAITQKLRSGELWFLCTALLLNEI